MSAAAATRPRRRSKRDLELGRVLEPGQLWLCVDSGVIWRVTQVHRQDCDVDLRHAGARASIPFSSLRAGYARVLDTMEVGP